MTDSWSMFERGSAGAFVVGGLAILLDVVAQAVTAGEVPAWVNTLLGIGGIWLISIGLIGFYPKLVDAARRPAIAGLVTGGVAWVLLTIGLGWSVLRDLTGQGTFGEGPPMGDFLFIGALVMVLLSFLVYGIWSVRTRTPSRVVGLMLLVPFVAFLLLVGIFFAGNALGTDPPVPVLLVLFGLAALGTIAVGSGPDRLVRSRVTPDREMR